ncbi:MAG: indolepyruvate oxidoreductase subunit beta [bacterium]|jgi:indolepyruvate ferredoxin oxidoreductase beta subunit
MTRKVTSILLVGVGGQGTILASKILTKVLLQSGFDVKMAEIHGMAQRGGSVVTHVKFGAQVFAPVVTSGEVDYLLAFEKLEGLRWLNYLRPGGVVIVNDLELPPLSVLTGQADYPQDINDRIRQRAGQVNIVSAEKIALQVGNYRSQNMVLLGGLARYLGIEKPLWELAMIDSVPAKTVAMNKAAFNTGWNLVKLE